MKNFLATASLIPIFVGGIAFANVEMDVNVYLNPSHSYNIEEKSDYSSVSMKQSCAIGTEMQWGFFIGHPSKILDIGINFSYGTDLFRNMDIGNAHGDGIIGVNAHAALGPAFRLSPFDWFSVYISPSFKVNTAVHIFESSQRRNEYWEELYLGSGIVMITPEINLDLGARFWVVRASKFHFGLDVGVDLSWDIPSHIWHWNVIDSDWAGYQNLKENKYVNYGFGANMYLGLCFNFGKTSYTHFKDLENASIKVQSRKVESVEKSTESNSEIAE